MKEIGLYLHIPFCASKCPYCDFYSFRADDSEKDAYTKALIHGINENFDRFQCKANTLYIGGGTPSVLGKERLGRIIAAAGKTFLSDSAEITVECNPYGLSGDFFSRLYDGGVNRVSMGLQSADDGERKKLGRRGTVRDVRIAVENARKAGIRNISLDVMLGVPGGNIEKLKKTLRFCSDEGVSHISCYILTLEKDTPFYRLRDSLKLPGDDEVADMYLFMCDYLESRGYLQYEISNFAKKGFESKHNLKYWNDEEYLGIGAAAHSFMNGKRFYYPRDEKAFINGCSVISDGEGGDFSEYAMLRLRLTEGLLQTETQKRYGFDIPENMRKKAKPLKKAGLLISDEKGIRLTKRGFLVSNSVISELVSE